MFIFLHTETIHLVHIFPNPWDYEDKKKEFIQSKNHWIALDKGICFLSCAKNFIAQICFIAPILMAYFNSAMIIVPPFIDKLLPEQITALQLSKDLISCKGGWFWEGRFCSLMFFVLMVLRVLMQGMIFHDGHIIGMACMKVFFLHVLPLLI